jgi:hypothetical protein
MTRLEDRQTLLEKIHEAQAAGARLELACALAGVDARTVLRWQDEDRSVRDDGRPGAIHPRPAHALTEAERARIVAVANEPRFAEMPPARIVPALADEGTYIASEASFHRVLREHDQMKRRGSCPPPACQPSAQHAHRHPPWRSLVLGHDVPADARTGTVVPPVPDP